MFGKRREEKLLEQIADVNEDLQRKLSKSERTLKDINTFLSFLSESVCKGKNNNIEDIFSKQGNRADGC